MRVCHIGFNFFPGRGLTIFYEFARQQALQGMQVSAIAPGRADESEFETIEGIRTHRVALDSIGRFSAGRLGFLRKAARIVREERFDLVHVYAFVGAGLLPVLGRTPGCVWLYDCQTSAIKPPLLGLQNRLIRAEASAFDAVTVLSEGIRDIVFGRRTQVEAIVPLGANFEHFKPAPPDPALRLALGFSEHDCIFAYCGTLDHNRRIDRLVEAFSRVSLEAPAAKLLVIGEGSALGELKEQARRLGLQDQVVFTGHVDYARIPSYLAVSSVALAYVPMDACFEHQPPTKTVEYLAEGLAVLATDTDGNRVFVRDGVNGLLCGDDPEACAGAMLELLRDPGKRARLAAAARDSVRSFDWSEIVRTHVLPVYRRLTAPRFAR